MLSVLYQIPHGTKKDEQNRNAASGVHTLLTVQCPDSYLLVKPAPSEGFDHQLVALTEACGPDVADVHLIYSDNPEVLDVQALFDRFTNQIVPDAHIAICECSAVGDIER